MSSKETHLLYMMNGFIYLTLIIDQCIQIQ